MTEPIKNRYEFVFLFDVKDGNPNGDPDQANLPRVDPENQEGLVSDVCIKRKVRNYVQIKHGLAAPHDIFIRQRSITDKFPYLNKIIESFSGTVADRQDSLCSRYFDIRTFGAVLSTGKENKEQENDDTDGSEAKQKGNKSSKVKGAGTVRGPVQFTFSRSEDRIYQADHSITRCAVTTEEEAKKQESREHASTFGRKATVPYAVYRMHGFISAVNAVKTGFSEDDLKLLWEALLNAFEHDRSAARGEMSPRALIVFKHESHLGNARASDLFSRVIVTRKTDLPRSWSDYDVKLHQGSLPDGISVDRKL